MKDVRTQSDEAADKATIEALEAESRMRTALAKINGAMRGVQTPIELCQNILTSLTGHMNAQIGSFFLTDDEVFLRRVAVHAYADPDGVARTFGPNEGLIGQAAIQGKILHLSNIPSDYIKIRSSLGDMPPRHLIVVPVGFDGRLNGVFELGSLLPFTGRDIQLLELISENIGIAVDLATSRMRLRALLEKSQEFNEELQTQQEELKTANEELQTQQEELRTANEELAEQQNALQEAQTKLEMQQSVLEETNAELEQKQQTLEEQKRILEETNLALAEARRIADERTRDAETASSFKSEFLSNMSHELRTPLNSILILTQMMIDNRSGRLGEEEIESAQTIAAAGSDLLTLINDILDLSKIEAGQVNLSVETVDMRALLRSLERSFKPTAETRGLSFASELDPDAIAQIKTDRQRLEQILKNFLSNAIKFTEKGEVTLRISRPRDEAWGVAITVADTGIGIPPAKHDVIFEAFKQADGTTSRRFGGTGLGLSISKELAALLGGRIELKSREGQGSAFTLLLPHEFRAKVEVDEAAAQPPPRMGPPVVRKSFNAVERSPVPTLSGTPADTMEVNARRLVKAEKHADDRDQITKDDRVIQIVEDEPKFARILADQTRRLGFKCLLSEDGESALDDARRFLPHGIILDMKLPGISGLEVLQALKDGLETQHIPVHIISGLDQSRNALHLGAVGYLMKPVSSNDLMAAFDRIETTASKAVKHVLIVEDDERQLDVMRKVINGEQGVKVAGVGTAREALEALKSSTFDCMVLDLRLPDMSGLELLEIMANTPELAHPPVIVYTGKRLSQQEEAALRRYADSIIIKSARSPERLLNESTLFLHRLGEELPAHKKELLQKWRGRDKTLEDATILVVDDDMRNIFAVTRLLEQSGAKVEIARNGEEALAILKDKTGVDLVLMDIMMPVMDGYEAMKRIRKIPRFARLPIIALTAKAMKGDAEKCLAAGASDYLPKPLDTKRLLSVVRVWLSAQGR